MIQNLIERETQAEAKRLSGEDAQDFGQAIRNYIKGTGTLLDYSPQTVLSVRNACKKIQKKIVTPAGCGETPAIWAVRMLSHKVLKKILNNCFTINTTSIKDDKNLLEWAVVQASPKCLACILSYMKAHGIPLKDDAIIIKLCRPSYPHNFKTTCRYVPTSTLDERDETRLQFTMLISSLIAEPKKTIEYIQKHYTGNDKEEIIETLQERQQNLCRSQLNLSGLLQNLHGTTKKNSLQKTAQQLIEQCCYNYQSVNSIHDGITPLLWAVTHGLVGTTQQLLNPLCPVNITIKDNHNLTAHDHVNNIDVATIMGNDYKNIFYTKEQAQTLQQRFQQFIAISAALKQK